MDIKQLAVKPKLIQLEVNNQDIIDQVGESVIFFMKEYLDLATYFDFYKIQESGDYTQLTILLRKLVLDKDGNPAIAEDEILPVEITLAILFKINEYVGNLKAKASTVKTGAEQN
jgi:hypothetical protein